MLLQKLTLTTEFADISFRANTKILVILDKQAQLVAEVAEIFVIGGSSEQKHIAILVIDKCFDIAITRAISAVSQVMTFVNNYQSEIAGIVDVDGLSHRHDFNFQIIFRRIFLPHFLQVGRANNKRAACKSRFIEFCNGTSGDGLTQTYHVTNHRTASFLIAKMSSCDFDGSLLEIEKFFSKFRRQSKFFNARASLLAKVIGGL